MRLNLRRPLSTAALAAAAMLAAAYPVVGKGPYVQALDALTIGTGYAPAHVGSNAALKSYTSNFLQALASAVTPTVVERDSFYQGGGGPVVRYTYSSAACGAADDGLQVTAASGGCWLADAATARTPKLWGAKGDGTTDDTAAVLAWAASVTAYTDLLMDPAVYVFKTPFKFPVVDHVHITGRGAVLLYAGSNTNTDLVTVGNANTGNCTVTDWTVEDLAVQSSTKMTGGDAWKLNWTCKSKWRNPTAGIALNPSGNLWNGIHGNGGNNLHIFEPGSGAQNDAILLNGDTKGQFTDPWIGGAGLLLGSKVGLHVAGNVGGLMVEDTDILLNGTDVLIDQSQVAIANLQIFLSSSVFLDATTGSGHNIWIKDAGGSESYLSIQGAWIAGTTDGSCVLADTGTSGWRVEMVGGSVRNCSTSGIVNAGNNLIEVSSTYMDNMNVGLDNSAGLGTMTQCGVRYSARFTTGQTTGPVPTTCGADGNSNGKYKALYAGLRGFGNTLKAGGGSVAALVPGSQQGEQPEISLYGTFTGTSDNGPRRIADLTAGFAGTWGTEFACLGVGMGNAAGNDTETPNTPRFCMLANGHETLGQGAATPTVSGCGTNPPAVVGTDRAGTFTSGTGTGQGCTFNFATAYNAEPICTLTAQSGVTLNYTKTKSAITLNGLPASTRVDYHCTAQVGG